MRRRLIGGRSRSVLPASQLTFNQAGEKMKLVRYGRPGKEKPGMIGANDNIMLPPDSTHTDWEVELGVVIGRTARHVAVKDAMKHVAGYCIVNDVSEREYQMKRSATQWNKGKGCDTFGPLGPYPVTP